MCDRGPTPSLALAFRYRRIRAVQASQLEAHEALLKFTSESSHVCVEDHGIVLEVELEVSSITSNVDGQLADALRRNDSAAFATAVRRLPNFVSLGDSALKLAIEGVTTMEEVLRIAGQVAENPLMERISVDTSKASEKTAASASEQEH